MPLEVFQSAYVIRLRERGAALRPHGLRVYVSRAGGRAGRHDFHGRSDVHDSFDDDLSDDYYLHYDDGGSSPP
ncbi:MAG: hypothetical protein VYC56_10270, partial [Actinomycetota bacterium]|nr:hypothetical protein [Actinomycetota bacterium]